MSNRGLKNTPLNSACHITVQQEHRSTAADIGVEGREKRRRFKKKQFFLVEVGEKSGTSRRNITNWESWLRKRLKKGESVRKVKPCASLFVTHRCLALTTCVIYSSQFACSFAWFPLFAPFNFPLQFSPISIYKIWKSKMKCIEGKPVHSVCLEIISESNWDLFFFLTDLSFWFSFHLFFFCLTRALKSCCHYSLLSFQGLFPLQNTFRSII